MTELKPCPFCGGEANVDKQEEDFLVECEPCQVSRLGWTDSRPEAIAAWNRRADGWVSVDERLPEGVGTYLVSYADGLVSITSWLDGSWMMHRQDQSHLKPRHWMALPESP